MFEVAVQPRLAVSDVGFDAMEKSAMLSVLYVDHDPAFPALSTAWTRQYQTPGLRVSEYDVVVIPVDEILFGELNEVDVSSWML
jgi:hypothetical protein